MKNNANLLIFICSAFIIGQAYATDYGVVIMADPQPWRLPSGDPNSTSNKPAWDEINKATRKSIASLGNPRFAIVNGDLSEFGRPAQYQNYYDIYRTDSSSDPHIMVLEGLGNHDYANNVGDCTLIESGSLSSNGCAISAIQRMFNTLQDMNIFFAVETLKATQEGREPLYNSFRYDASHSTFSSDTTFEDSYSGSLAYSWDAGEIHYVQLQNYPSYSVSISAGGYGTAQIKDSISWLETDLALAKLRGKTTIINFHDARPASDDGDSHFLTQLPVELQKIIPWSDTTLAIFNKVITSYDVKAIFVGHTHQQAYCRATNDAVFGNIPVYTAGALFNGDYYWLDVKGKTINVKAYNGKTGSPTLVKDLGTIGSDTDFSKTCSSVTSW